MDTLDEMVDMLVAFLRMKPPRGPNLCAIGNGGGASVLATDAWSSAGFALPPVPPALKAALDDTAMNKAGMILHNPLDFSMAGYTGFFFDVVKRMIAHEDFVDLGIIHNPSGHGARRGCCRVEAGGVCRAPRGSGRQAGPPGGRLVPR